MGASKSLISSVLLDEPAASGAVVTSYDTEGDLPSTNTEGAYVSVSGVVYRWSDAVSWYVPSDWYAVDLALCQDDSSEDADCSGASATSTTLAAAGWTLVSASDLGGGGVTISNAGGGESRLDFGTANGITWPSKVGIILQVLQTSQDGASLRPEIQIRNGTKILTITLNRSDTIGNVGFISAFDTYHASARGSLTATSYETLYVEVDFASGGVCEVFDLDGSGRVVIGRDDLSADTNTQRILVYCSALNTNEAINIKRLQVVDLT